MAKKKPTNTPIDHLWIEKRGKRVIRPALYAVHTCGYKRFLKWLSDIDYEEYRYNPDMELYFGVKIKHQEPKGLVNPWIQE